MRILRRGTRLVSIIAAVLIAANWRAVSFAVVNAISPPYDEDFYEQSFVVEDGVIYRLDDDGQRYPVLRRFADDFEDAAGIEDLIGIERGWTSFTLQSPEAPAVSDYVDLAQRILNGESGFLDNRVEPSSDRAHSGAQSLKAVSVAPGSGMCCTKASLDTGLLYFTRGDEVRFSAWYYLEQPVEYVTLMDLESTFVRGQPGMRIRLHRGLLEFELAKWEPNQVYRQPEANRIAFPTGRWVLIEARLTLSEGPDGVIQLFQNGALVIDRRGQTLPFAEAVYDSLEVGLSAYTGGPQPAILYVDDLAISAGAIDHGTPRILAATSVSSKYSLRSDSEKSADEPLIADQAGIHQRRED